MAATRPTLMVMKRPTYASFLPTICVQTRLQGPICVASFKTRPGLQRAGYGPSQGVPGAQNKMEVLPLGQNPNPGSPDLYLTQAGTQCPESGQKYFSYAGPDFRFFYIMAPSLQSQGESVYTC